MSLARGSGHTLFLSDTETVFSLRGTDPEDDAQMGLSMSKGESIRKQRNPSHCEWSSRGHVWSPCFRSGGAAGQVVFLDQRSSCHV